MRNKIDYGIDLGTTNSAIARMENGVPIIKKSDTLKDTVPSCVHYNKRKDILVGDTAFNVLKNDKIRALKSPQIVTSNTFIEFKRTMGTTHLYECPNISKNLTSEDLSAEVLKKLKSFIQDENISSIVITIPAKFKNPEIESTMKAAKLAGFKHVQLLQEPVAAATAYGLGSSIKDGYWLVFDFGGGTFDAALVKADEGILSVKDTDGDNWLGGKNLDEAIVDQLIIPYLKENYAIDSILDDATKKEILRNAVKPFAEEAKIQLSFKDTHNILSNLGDLPFEDDNGDEPEIDILVTQKEMESVVSPIFQTSIDITKEILKRNNLRGSDISTLILVGGPTYSPILRRMLKEQVTENVDTSVDPMTVVAKGACLFASTISVSDEVKDDLRDKTKLQLDLKYEATTVEAEEMVNIKILKEKSLGVFPEKIYAEIVRNDGAWSSGKKLIGEKATIVDVLLIEGRSNAFDINIYDDEGNKLDCQPKQFSILQGIGGLDGMQVLPYNIGIGKWFKDKERDGFEPAKGLEKNKRIPAVGVINELQTRGEIRPGMVNDVIRIPIYQGVYNSSGTNPVLNNFINEVVITGESIPKLLPSGSPVEITIKVDKSQIMLFSAYFPTIDYTEELEIDIKQTIPMTIEELKNQLVQAKNKAKKLGDITVAEKIEKLEDDFENKKGSEVGRMEIQDGLRKELFKLDGMEDVAQWPKVETELKDSFFELEKLVRNIKIKNYTDEININKVESQVQEFKSMVEHVIKEKNLKDAKSLISDIDSYDYNLRNVVTGNGMDVQYLKQIENSFDQYHWKDRNKARQLCNQGLQLIAEGNTAGVRPVIRQLIDLMPEEERGNGLLS